jgi:predicted methyltransferase
VIDEVKKAGFDLQTSGDFMKNPDDAHDKGVFDPSIRGKTDRMALLFVKPVK